MGWAAGGLALGALGGGAMAAEARGAMTAARIAGEVSLAGGVAMSAASIGVGVKQHNDLMIFGGAVVGLGTTAGVGGVSAYRNLTTTEMGVQQTPMSEENMMTDEDVARVKRFLRTQDDDPLTRMRYIDNAPNAFDTYTTLSPEARANIDDLANSSRTREDQFTYGLVNNPLFKGAYTEADALKGKITSHFEKVEAGDEELDYDMLQLANQRFPELFEGDNPAYIEEYLKYIDYKNQAGKIGLKSEFVISKLYKIGYKFSNDHFAGWDTYKSSTGLIIFGIAASRIGIL